MGETKPGERAEFEGIERSVPEVFQDVAGCRRAHYLYLFSTFCGGVGWHSGKASSGIEAIIRPSERAGISSAAEIRRPNFRKHAEIILASAEIGRHILRMNAENMVYIWQQQGWPNFIWDAPALAAKLESVHRSQNRLLGRMEQLGFPLRAEATLQSLTEEVLKSSDIEGEVLDKAQVRSSIARRLGIEAAGLVRVERRVEGIVAMMLDATQRHLEPLSENRLFGWQAALFPAGRSGLQKIAVGQWRLPADDPMQVVSGAMGRERVHFEAPPASTVRREMKAFLERFNAYDGTDLVLRAGIAHLWFVTIHPFADGNGRIARAIADMALARSEKTAQRFYSMSAQIRQERDGYYEILESTQKGGLDITAWLDWFLGCLARALGNADGVLGDVLTKARFWDRHRNDSLSDRQRLVLNRLLDGFEGKLTSSKWAALAKCSQDTAGRDIDDLVKRGFLRKGEAGGRSTNYSLVR